MAKYYSLTQRGGDFLEENISTDRQSLPAKDWRELLVIDSLGSRSSDVSDIKAHISDSSESHMSQAQIRATLKKLKSKRLVQEDLVDDEDF